MAGFEHSAPNPVLMAFAKQMLNSGASDRALDVGCGAGRNAVPLAQMGWEVVGIEASKPMLDGAARCAHDTAIDARLRLIRATMDAIPVQKHSCDLIVAHGIWNLARSDREFRGAVEEAARIAKPGAGLFVYTFARETLPERTEPVAGESFVYREFSGRPQCFLTAEQLDAEMQRAGFARHDGMPLTVYNRPTRDSIPVGKAPVLLEAAFRYEG